MLGRRSFPFGAKGLFSNAMFVLGPSGRVIPNVCPTFFIEMPLFADWKTLNSHFGFVTQNATHIENTQDASCMSIATYILHILHVVLLLDWHPSSRTMDAQRKIFEKWRLKSKVEVLHFPKSTKIYDNLISKASFLLPLSLDVPKVDPIFRLDESQDSLDKLWQGLIKHQLLFHGICSGSILKGIPKSGLGWRVNVLITPNL